MFNTLIVQPIFNLLVLIYALLPGHDFGMAIIIFTILIRLLMWPLIKKQLHHTKQLRKLQPEIKKIKAATKGNKQEESRLTMELYKERKINPFSALGLTLLQFPILIGLYIGLRKLITNPKVLITFTYPFVRHIAYIQFLGHDIGQFKPTLFNLVDLNRAALGPHGVWYFPALVLVTASAVMQYFISKQLLPQADEKKSLRQIMKDAGKGKSADQTDMQAATGRFTSLMIPFLIFFITLRIASALSLYWFVSSLVAYIQQAIVLRDDETEMEAIGDEPVKKKVTAKSKAKPVVNTAPATQATRTGPSGTKIIEGEVISKPKNTPKKGKSKKRRK